MKLYLAVFLLFPCFIRADSVYLDESFPEDVRSTLQNLADDVWDIVQEMYHNTPPVNVPIYVHNSANEVPFTQLDHPRHPQAIRIRISATGTHYAQFAFQLGHELGHVMLDPRRANGTIEAICNATSYEVLARLGDRVRSDSGYSWLSDYAPHFREYLRDDEKMNLERFPQSVRDMVKQKRWADVTEYLHQHLSDMDPGRPEERATQTLAAIALRSGPVEWGPLTGLAGCTTPSPDQSPKFQILPLNSDCKAPVSDLLARFGAN